MRVIVRPLYDEHLPLGDSRPAIGPRCRPVARNSRLGEKARANGRFVPGLLTSNRGIDTNVQRASSTYLAQIGTRTYAPLRDLWVSVQV